LRAELLIFNGTIHTLDPLHPTAEAVSVANGRVLGVGTLEAVEPAADANTRRIDLRGRTLIPGFNDAYFAMPLSATDFENSVQTIGRSLLKFGVTSFTHVGLLPDVVAAYWKLTEARRMPFRVNVIARRYTADGIKIPLPERHETNWLRVETVLIDRENDPKAADSEERLRALIWDIHRGGLRAAILASDENAIRAGISAISYASGRLASRMKHRLDQVAAPNADQLAHCRGRINMTVGPDAGTPLRAILDAGVTVALSSHATNAEDASPLAVIKAITESTGIAVAELLPLYTLNTAILSGDDHLKGTISPGKYADFALLSGDPLRAPVDRLQDIAIDMTILNGQIAYSSER
jgi:predicted amidohydrolase YtcJ